MESLALFVDEEWDNLSRMFSSEEHYSNQLHGHGLFPINAVETPSTFWSADESSNENAPVLDEGLFLNYYFSQENSTSCGTSTDTNTNTDLSLPTPTPTYENYYHHATAMPNNYSDDVNGMDDKANNFLSQVFSDDVMEEILCLKQAGKLENDFDGQQMGTIVDHPHREMLLKRKYEMPELSQASKDEDVQIDLVDKNPKKKQRISRENNKNKKSVQSKKNQKRGTDTNEGEQETNNNNNNNGGGNGQSSTSYCSEEEDSNSNSNGSQESNGEGALNLNGKTRASRGAATDPQSLYARKRRERINERLRILQNLVPNGTKVDISTMLEEAVHYVKFLQLQIKLLSSDDMWMYAPIAYNGMDMGLYQKISTSVQ